MTTIFIDVNVIMYAAGAPHPYKDPCVRILTDIENGRLNAAINTEILQELLYRYSRLNLAQKGIRLCREVMQLPLTVLPVSESDLRLAVTLFETSHAAGLRPRDAIHAATMQNNGLV